MHFPPVHLPVSTRAPLWRLWSCLLLVLGLCLMDAAHAGRTYTFDGGKVLDCRHKAKVYTCPNLRLPDWDDKMVIEDGYTVNVSADVSFGWNQGLRMSGTARLTSTGSINLTGLGPGSLFVNGGSFEAGGNFSVAGPRPFRADFTAGTLTLGTGTEIRITGKMVSRGAVSVASNATIIGPVSGTSIMTNSPFKITGDVTASGTLKIIEGAIKGSVITADSPVTLTGNVTATSRFTLGSGSTVSGNIVAPEVELHASKSNITGNITASKLLTMGDSVKVKGTVDTGTLTMNASNAMIEGAAKVNFATLYWNGRVTQPIVCKAGTRPGHCDCVDNQSGNPVNSTNGPRCEGPSPVAGTLSHFLIEHDGNDAATCSSKEVKVSACTNDNCSQTLSTPTRVTMQPGGASASFTGSGTVQVASARKGVNQLSLTSDGAATPVRCRNTKNNAASCDVNFTGDVGFRVSVPDHKAGNWVRAELQALRTDGAACVPAFVDVKKPVQYSCSHTEPKTGTLPVKLRRTESSPDTAVALMCDPNKLVLWETTFDGQARTAIELTYTDAGKVTLNAKTDDISGADAFIAAPDHFVIATPSPLRAGLDFDVTLTAKNADNNTTPNFDKNGYTATGATTTTVSMPCKAGNGVMQPVQTEFSGGKAKIAANFTEAGWINLQAELNEFLGSEVTTVSATGNNAVTPCTLEVGPFVPMYFQVELNDTGRIVAAKDGKELAYYYSREPIPLKVTAMNAQGQATTNYPAGYGSDHAFALSAVATDGKSLDAGTLAGTLAASDFVAGVATWTPSTKSPQATFQFTNPRAKPMQIRVRVENKAATGALPTGHDITSAGASAHEKAQPEIRIGRLRIATVFGRAASTLKLPVTAEYWSGNSWLRNDKDDFTIVPAAAIAQTSHAHANGSGAKPRTQVFSDLELGGGEALLPVQGDAAGWIDIAFNLGPGTGVGPDQSCLKSHPTTTFAGMPWLQSLSGCIDPSGRATFGIFAPESRRIIHMREVFN